MQLNSLFVGDGEGKGEFFTHGGKTVRLSYTAKEKRFRWDRMTGNYHRLGEQIIPAHKHFFSTMIRVRFFLFKIHKFTHDTFCRCYHDNGEREKEFREATIINQTLKSTDKKRQTR